MKKTWLYILGFMVMGMIALGVGPARAATAPGPYYATPSWDQKLQCDTTSTCPRFIVLSNWDSEAVLDRETGLVWEQSPGITVHDWYSAQYVCMNKTVGGRKGLRLPTVQELSSLIDPSVPGTPKLPSGHPFSNVQFSNVTSSLYWSATTYTDLATFAWVVTVYYGDVYNFFKDYKLYVWCVRGGQGHENQ